MLAAVVTRMVGDGAVLLVAVYLQQAPGLGPLGAGLLLAPQGLVAVVGLRIGGGLIDRHGARTVSLIGTVVLLAGMVPLALAPGLPATLLGLVLVVRGLGTSLVGLPPVAAAYQDLDRHRSPRAGTTMNIAQRLGTPLGSAVVITVVATAMGGGIDTAFRAAFTAAAIATAAIGSISLLLPRDAVHRSPEHNG